MRAAVYRRFGGPDVVKVREVPRPAPGKGEIAVGWLWVSTFMRTWTSSSRAT